MSKIREKDLHLYLDGELTPAEAARIRRMAEDDESLAGRIQRIDVLRRALGDHFSKMAEPGADLDVWPQLQVRLGQARPATLLERLGWFFSWHSRSVGWSVAGALTAALVALGLILGRGSDRPVGGTRERTPVPAVSNRLVVEDYQGPPPTIFEIPDDHGHTTVLWVQPTDDGQGGQGGRDAGVPRARSPGAI